ncbi:hypothetical protein I316_06095 [Kwoniella heveanensis BCC8398]|uniref:Uncharacterized protein n=1 Tax=Kwoniella heveanensis BCC8398 TaxID=1296120 RepID=A0A1B9GMG8_9TREE|nr:hypothetical protein I316_06095 [Kwoniella heveanensis BCC8398]
MSTVTSIPSLKPTSVPTTTEPSLPSLSMSSQAVSMSPTPISLQPTITPPSVSEDELVFGLMEDWQFYLVIGLAGVMIPAVIFQVLWCSCTKPKTHPSEKANVGLDVYDHQDGAVMGQRSERRQLEEGKSMTGGSKPRIHVDGSYLDLEHSSQEGDGISKDTAAKVSKEKKRRG